MLRKQKKPKRSRQEEALLEEINLTKLELETAYSHFENAVDPDLIESCIYRINSIQDRYKYLLKQLKSAQAQEASLLLAQQPASR